jgi:hypothetical protein
MKFFFNSILCSSFIIGILLDADENKFQKHFDDVLLIINYNFCHYDTIPFLKKIYGDYFNHIVFYGPESHAGVNQYSHHQGYLSYGCIADAMKKYPHFKGYLYTHDDCVINPWKLIQYSKNTLWFPYWKSAYWKPQDNLLYPNNLTWPIFDTKVSPNYYSKWYWWSSIWGYLAVIKSLKKYPKKNRLILAKNIGHKKAIGSFGDFVYIPALLKNDYIKLAKLFLKNKVFLEIALPTICHSLSYNKLWERAEGFCWAGTNLYSYDIDFHHPFKLSNRETQDFVEKLFQKARNIYIES